MRMQEYMVLIEKAAEQSKNNMYNNTLDGVSAYVQQSVCNSPVPLSDQNEAYAENLNNCHIMLILMTH